MESPAVTKSGAFARRTLLALTGVVTATLLLAGCAAGSNDAAGSSSEPSVAVTATAPPALDAPPESEEHALESAEAKLAEYFVVLNTILGEGGVSPERINQVAVSPQLELFMDGAKNISDNKMVMTGDAISTVTASSISDGVEGDTAVPFGTATITTCFDGSPRTMTFPDGSPAPRPQFPRTLSTFTINYLPSMGDWFISDQKSDNEPC
ncbi:hypothetical protein B0I08_10498 [Glaciihabitans tibetensis]|uniref:Uncharacterized protein n=1 Tax=Glaciihabitans tibetensis TaxID=1266600 RepID=A0A2T0VDZ0_9MICO|nr:hypothetical protein [Glaciihabitans tibetensis]PRY68396.1 hypothetical protein B0I08_10498 [Glaciihabitans tibetensis]